MARNDWENLGDTIRDLVEDAVNSQDYHKLNQTITSAVNRVVNGATGGFRSGGSQDPYDTDYKEVNEPGPDRHDAGSRGQSSQRQYSNGPGSAYRPNPGYGGQNAGRTAAERVNRQQDRREGQRELRQGQAVPQGNSQQSRPSTLRPKRLYISSSRMHGGALAMTIVGFILGGIFGLTLLILMMVMAGGVVNTGMWLALLTILPLFAGSMILGGFGRTLLGSAKRFQRYLQGIGDKTYCNIEELAMHTGKSRGYVLRDLRKMIRKGWFLEGHLDEANTCLMTSDTTFREYLDIQKQKEQIPTVRKVQEEKIEKEEKAADETAKVIEEGRTYIQEIRKCSGAISGQEIPAKISRMELLAVRIFDRISDHPEQITDIQKMMKYYLPTTVKLLHAYQELDAEPIQGENILNSKKEIEETLDTLNYAFEKLLDDLFQDTAWDVSSDISVLHTMLKQEGLTKSDF